MLTLRDLVYDIPATMGNDYIVVGLRDRFRYVNGVRTDTTNGANVDIVLRDRDYQRVAVAVPSAGINLTPEDIVNNVHVTFGGLTIRVYVIDGVPKVVVRADTVTVVPTKRAAA